MFWRLFVLRRKGVINGSNLWSSLTRQALITSLLTWRSALAWITFTLIWGNIMLIFLHWNDTNMLNPHIWKVDNDAHLMWCDGEEPVDQPDPWDGREEDKPEVEEHIDLETATVTQKSWWWITILYQRQKGWSWPIIIMVFKMVLLTMMLMQWFTFSLMMFKGRTQRASCFCRDPDGPNFWKEHFATWGR